MKKIYYNKLIRDKVPANMKAKGVDFEIRELNDKEILEALLEKVEEEAGGVVSAKNRSEVIDELADLHAVVEEVKRIYKITPAEFKKVFSENIKKKGGFSERIWLIWSADNGYRTNEKRNGKK